MRRFFIHSGVILLLAVAAELYLRLYWGFCDAVLMQASDKYEYIAQPDQKRFRFRRHVEYNRYSIRSKPLKQNDRARILCFGDSVINGGVQTDQDSLATTIIENRLTQEYGQGVRCLNISAGSWGPDNCFAYLEEKGDFGADAIVLVVNSHDAYDNMDFKQVVDVHPSYPARQYRLAMWELLDRYAIPRLMHKRKPDGDPIIKGDTFNPGFGEFYEYSRQKGIPLLVYADRSEVDNGKYDYQGEEIIKFCAANDIRLIEGLATQSPDCFRDHIHPNDKGQRMLASVLLPEIENIVDKKFAVQ